MHPKGFIFPSNQRSAGLQIPIYKVRHIILANFRQISFETVPESKNPRNLGVTAHVDPLGTTGRHTGTQPNPIIILNYISPGAKLTLFSAI